MRGLLVRAVSVAALGASLSSGVRAEQVEGGFACSDAALGVTTDRDERTLVVGAAFDNRVLEWDAGHAHYGDLAVARLLADGSPDPSFGDRGNVVVDLGDFDELSEVLSVAGGVYAAGTTATTAGDRSGPADAVVVRLDRAGRLDPAFGSGGLALLDLDGDEAVVGLAQGPRGSVYVAGSSVAGDGASQGFIARLTSSGVLDRRFGETGVVRVSVGSTTDGVLSITSSWRGVRVGGQTVVDGEAGVFAADFDHRGQARLGFGADGLAVARVGGSAASAVAFHGRRGNTAVTVLRDDAAGAVESVTTIFDDRGRVRRGGADAIVATLPAGSDAMGGALWWSGSLYLSGSIYTEDFALGDAFLARVGRSQGLDPTFAGAIVSEHLELEYAAYLDLSAGARGVTVAGWEFSESEERLPRSDALVARYGHDGVLDTSFGNDGLVLLDFHGGDAVCGPAEHID